ncbi:centromere/microtubule-binding protein cbf5 [Mucor velutinosus]|uniref:Centromere/microtubule-binding protein cbf5 n=1 Tax=Mucor velutinosus TaxID=708070 RepID=A0AAN7HL94_9FUNG|nr:centromere/microtubule-binding protein cbf5 [Mucor velutinosus]
MLNPLAHDFTPISAFSPEAPSQEQPKTPPPPKRKEEQSKKKQTKPKATTTTNTLSTSTSTSTSAVKGKKKDTQANSKKQQQQHRDSKNKHRSAKTTHDIPNHVNTTTTAPSDLFAKESKFITIEAAIDPIRRIKETAHANSLQHHRQSINNDKYQVEHGYEQYIDWIDRSLRLFDTVTLVGMGNAVVDIVSLVTILQDRRIGVHDGNLSS